MMLDPLVAGLAAIAIAITALAAFGAIAIRFGADSRPGIGDRNDRSWLVASH